MNKKDLFVGQKVWMKPGVNTSRRIKGPREGEITKVGRKYLEVAVGGKTYKYDINTFKEVSDYVADWHLYCDLQQLLDEEERAKLTTEIRKTFDRHNKRHIS